MTDILLPVTSFLKATVWMLAGIGAFYLYQTVGRPTVIIGVNQPRELSLTINPASEQQYPELNNLPKHAKGEK